MQPLATYRIQLRPELDFDAAADLVSYLQALGISHLYCSPYLQAVPGSSHGYDVVDPTRVNAELGGPEGHARLCRTLAQHGLGQLLDIVPNHMAIHSGNPWWWDVLELGPASRWARFFDVDWAPGISRENVVLLPVLADHYGRILEAGGISVRRDGPTLRVAYEDNVFPVAPRSVEPILRDAADRAGFTTLGCVADLAAALDEPESMDPRDVETYRTQCQDMLSSLARIVDTEPGVPDALDAAIDSLNADPDALDALLGRQYYRLAFWRMANTELEYRRFFDINTLVGVCVEHEDVFLATHRRVIEWLEQGLLDGVRVDHIDGLYDPLEYLRRLRDAAPGAWIVVEKILEPNECLSREWPVSGTTGYDFLNVASGLFVDPEAETPLTALYSTLTGEPIDYETLVHEKKYLILDDLLGSDVKQLTALLQAICERHRRYRDYTQHELAEALRQTIACFPVYRTYVRAADRQSSEADRQHVMRAVDAAKAQREDLDPALFDFLRELLLLHLEGKAEADFAMRFQQVTGPAMAKGVEDTVFYCYSRFVALNEVGGNPDRFGIPVDEFHAWASSAQRDYPRSLLATSTHDTKRSEDVRMRLTLLSEIPERWSDAVTRWVGMNESHWRGAAADRNAEYLLYQTLVGAWPIERERVLAYVEKAAREAKQHTSWTRPNDGYEQTLAGFVEAVMSDDTFISDLEAFVEPLVEPGRVNSLALTAIKLTSPGIPDVYQGTELWDFSLVDPDNRRQVDYDVRRDLLSTLADVPVGSILERSDEGLPKLWLIRQGLALRRARQDAFGADGSYRPLEARGAKTAHVIAFARAGCIATVAPRLVLTLDGNWQDTEVRLSRGRWRNLLTGEESGGGWTRVAQLLSAFPVALLERPD